MPKHTAPLPDWELVLSSAARLQRILPDALLRGDALDTAIAFGRAAALYDTAISRLARRIADAMRFLTEDKKATELHGRAITTMMDMFRLGRKYNFTPDLAEQNVADLGGETAAGKGMEP